MTIKTAVCCQGVGVDPWKIKLNQGPGEPQFTNLKSRGQPNLFPNHQQILKLKPIIVKKWNQQVPKATSQCPCSHTLMWPQPVVESTKLHILTQKHFQICKWMTVCVCIYIHTRFFGENIRLYILSGAQPLD